MTSLFTPDEIDYLQSQQLCRIATVGTDGQPHVTPVAFRYNSDTDTFDVSGHGGFAKRKKWRDVEQNPQIALVIDDIASTNPWKVRGIEIRGEVELRLTGGETVIPNAGPEMFHITPKRIVSWGIDTEAYGRPNSRTVNQS
jgi:pyridoxamine 5'-phosphate oxidase family protein